MDTAEEVNDDRTGSGLFGGLVFGECPVSKEDTKAGARVSFQHVHDGASGLEGLLGPDRSEDTVVDRIVQEQDLGGLDEDGNQRQQAVVDKDIDAGGQDCQDGGHGRTNAVEAQDGEYHTEDTDREVIDEHLEAGGHSGFHELVELFDAPAGERSHDHGAEEHRLPLGTADTGDRTCNSNGTHNTAAVSADHVAALSGDEHRDQVIQHVGLDGGQSLIREPAVCNEECGNKTPGDERTDVRHDHRREEFTELLESVFHRSPSPFSKPVFYAWFGDKGTVGDVRHRSLIAFFSHMPRNDSGVLSSETTTSTWEGSANVNVLLFPTLDESIRRMLSSV